MRHKWGHTVVEQSMRHKWAGWRLCHWVSLGGFTVYTMVNSFMLLAKQISVTTGSDDRCYNFTITTEMARWMKMVFDIAVWLVYGIILKIL